MSNEAADVNRFELLGRALNSLVLVRINYADGYKEDVPKALFLLTTFFLVHPEHFEKQGLFRVNGDRSKIEELSIHMQLGDFSILSKFQNNPNEVANFLKEILRELTEPVCPFEKYPDFRDINKLLGPQ